LENHDNHFGENEVENEDFSLVNNQNLIIGFIKGVAQSEKKM